MLKKEYEKLNDKQKQAVKTIHKNLLVLAPAGTGKTRVIAMRTAYLIEQHILPEQILCLTFTNKAAKEMKDRITTFIKQDVKGITIKTFHAFCYTLISSEKHLSHFSFPCTIIDEIDSEHFLKEIIEEKGFNDEGLYYPELRSFIEEIKRYSLTFEVEERYHYKQIVEKYFSEEKTTKNKKKRFIHQHGLSILRAYQHTLKANNCVDFMDLIVEAKYLLDQDEVKAKWNRKYRFIQVDEMQDTSTREYEMIKTLAEGNELAMFGDFNQTIYEWRGSNPQSMVEDFKRDFKPETIRLTENYRSTKTLLEASNDYIKTSALYPIQCEATSQIQGEKIEIIEAESKKQEIELIARLIGKRRKEGHKVAVLTRTNHYAKAISDYFQKVGLPCTVIEDTKFFRKKEIKAVLAFFDYGINPRNNHAILKVCQHPYMAMDKWLLERLSQTKDSYLYLHDWFNTDSKDAYADLSLAYKHQKVVVLDVESTGLDTTWEDIVQIAAIRYGEKGVVEKLDLLVKPTKPVGDSFYIHGFSDEVLKKEGIAPELALHQLSCFVKDSVIVGHNINYDLQIIASMLGRYGMGPLVFKAVYDTLDLAHKVYPKMSNHKLSTLARFVETKAQPNHNAMEDILATSEVLTHLLLKIEEKKQERLEKIEALYSYIKEYKSKVTVLKDYMLSHTVHSTIEYMMNNCAFKQYYTMQEIKNLRELYKIAVDIYDERLSHHDNMLKLLSYASLHYSELEQTELFRDRIPIITVHQAKGLEFDEVYIAGCNDKIFPSARSIKEGNLSEELRLFYVAMTRAKEKLFVSYNKEMPPSILIDEIGEHYKEYKTYSQTL